MSVVLIVLGLVAVFAVCALISESRPVRRWAGRWGGGGYGSRAPEDSHAPWGGDGGGDGGGGGGGGGGE